MNKLFNKYQFLKAELGYLGRDEISFLHNHAYCTH